MYTDDVEISDSNIHGILHLADKYDVPLLREMCSAFMTKELTPDTACSIFGTAHEYNLAEVKQKTLEYICVNASTCFNSDSFLSLNIDDLNLIASSELLSCSERTLFDALLKWAENKCNVQKTDATDENKRQCLGEVFYQVRFPLMDADALMMLLSEHNILTEAEISAISKDRVNQSTDRKHQHSRFSALPRKGCLPERRIFIQGNQQLIKTNPQNEDLELRFSVSHDSWLYGIAMYGPALPLRFCMEMSIASDDKDKPYQCQKMIQSKGGQIYTCDVLFDSPVCLRGNVEYILDAKIFTSKEVPFYRLYRRRRKRAYDVMEVEESDVENVYHDKHSVGNLPHSVNFGYSQITLRYKQIQVITQCNQIAGLLLY